VPLVVVPTAWDQPENAWRIVEAGAGVRLAPRRCSPEQIRIAVQRVLSDPSYRRNAARLAADFGRFGGPVQAAELLETLAVSQRRFSRHDGSPASAGTNVHRSNNGAVHIRMTRNSRR
jgi:UDP:flavonoid glycosyltransferase YjiC (YdhE family)